MQQRLDEKRAVIAELVAARIAFEEGNRDMARLSLDPTSIRSVASINDRYSIEAVDGSAQPGPRFKNLFPRPRRWRVRRATSMRVQPSSSRVSDSSSPEQSLNVSSVEEILGTTPEALLELRKYSRPAEGVVSVGPAFSPAAPEREDSVREDG